MPLYSYACPDCGGSKDEFRKLAERNNCPDCDLCNRPMEKVITSYAVVPDLEPYFDDNLQCGIKSKQHRKQVMREQGVDEKYGKGWR